MIPEQHHQVPDRTDADRSDREVAMRRLVGFKGERAVPPGYSGADAVVARKPTSAAIISNP